MSSMMKKLLAVDCDGVLVNYNAAYPKVWKKAFGTELPTVRPGAYHASNEFGLSLEDAEVKRRFFAHFDDEAWSTMPALAGAVEACRAFAAAGYVLVCVTSIPRQYERARLQNLQALGFPIEQVIATDRDTGGNPKLEVLRQLAPAMFVDDLVDNFTGIDWPMHRALIDAGQADSPNRGQDLSGADSTHPSLAAFARWWLNS